ncbi:type II toxin-antitoxin system PemK/MazF family toxin [Luteimonas suaedae]|uniref:type II toxin-antitoxin system PemK/MazF family toxin n=1 Tax=Luteimonas suaedae TaxID=2605430 RepID=UPI0011ED5B92|nr:type II toxin-antitoxin system PemK/MazF family toxin [Luteimonas suaedae]
MDREAKEQAIRHGFPINRGDIFWVAPDESKGAVPGSPHPHVVVQDDVFNHSRIASVVVCALTTNLNRVSEPGSILLESGEGGLGKQSIVMASQVSSLYKNRLGERIGALSSQRVDQVVAALRFLQASYFRGR